MHLAMSRYLYLLDHQGFSDTEAMDDQVLTRANAECLVSVPAPDLLMFRSWQLLSSFLLR